MSRIFLLILSFLVVLSGFAQSRAQKARYKVFNPAGEILAYSDNFDPVVQADKLPPFLQEILQQYKVKGSKRYASRTPGKSVAPLLKSTRTQEYPYNASAPFFMNENGQVSQERCMSGCVATALEQVVSYWRHPAELADTLFGWKTDNYVIPDVLPGTKIDWDNILPNYADGNFNETQAKAIGDLTYYLGVGVHMVWGLGSSAANLVRAVESLYRSFDYRTVYFLQRGLFSTPAWNRLLRNELENGRPIVYTGHNYSAGGHCFNIDGVDEEGYYHANWGEENMTLYLDLDYMNPFEPNHDPTDMGIHFGMFCNQTALFMHPDDFVIDIHDSLTQEVALRSVLVEDVTFSREPDIQGYVRADFSLYNPTSDSLNYTFEAFTYLPSDTAIFEQADFVGITTVNLAPGERRNWPIFCRFTEQGERIFGCTADGRTIPYTKEVTVTKGTSPIYRFGEPHYKLLLFTNEDGTPDLTARITFPMSNDAKDGAGSNTLTFCLFKGDDEEEYRHFDIPQVLAGETIKETVDFHHLEDGETYRFITRYHWNIQHTLQFEVHADEAVPVLSVPEEDRVDRYNNLLYDLSGRPVVAPGRGIYIQRGKKKLVQ